MSQRYALWVVIAAAAVVLLVRSASVPLLDPDESRFARTSVEMLRSGNLVVPTFGGEPRLVKPPLIHWIQSFFMSLFGPTEWAARIHAAGATLGSILLIGLFVRGRFGPEGGAWAAAVLATMPIVLVPGRVGTIDALLALHVFAVVALDMTGDEEGVHYRAVCVGGLLGLAFLAKGPVGVVLPLLIMLAGRTACGASVVPSLGAALRAAAAWSVVVLPWGLVFARRIGTGSVAQTLRAEVFERYFGGTAHPEPPWFFLMVGGVAFLPWLTPLLIGLGRAWRMRRDPGARTAVYAGAGLITGIVFFSLGRGKVATYILPLAPLAAILVTWELGREVEKPHLRTLGPALLSATLAACAVLLGLAAVAGLDGAPRNVAAVGAAIYAVGALFAGHGAVSRRPRRVYGGAVGSAAAFLLVVVSVLFPALGRTHSAASLIEAVPALGASELLVTVEIRVPSLAFYLDRVPEVLEMGDLEQRLSRDDAPIFVLAGVDLPDVPAGARERMVEIGRGGKYVAFEKRPSNVQ